MGKFDDDVLVVTGGASGIGRATALLLAQHGADVAIVDLNKDAGEAVSAEITALGRRAVAYGCDVSSYEVVEKTVKNIVEDFGHIDILFNNAGIAPRGTVDTMSAVLWDKVMAVCLSSMFYMTKACAPYLKKSRGSIINTGSDCSIHAEPNLAAYCAAKGGVLMLTKAHALDFKPFGVRVNAVLPGDLDTPLNIEALRDSGVDVDTLDKSEWQTPLDIAKAVMYFADRDQEQVSGNFLSVRGVNQWI
jgi:NAD(P)-dependent dehydrogenase (short-subunit alcohol dehydrogenase family)